MANGQKKRKRDVQEKRGWYEDLAVETKQSVWAVVSFAMALLLLLAWLGKAGLIGNSAYTFFTLLFGRGFFVVPLALFLAGISLLFRMREHIFAGTFFGGILFLLSVLGFGEIVLGSKTGGYVGLAIAYLPVRFFDTTASILIFSVMLIISVLIMFNTSLVPRRRTEDESAVAVTQAGIPSQEPPTILTGMGQAVARAAGAVQGMVQGEDQKQAQSQAHDTENGFTTEQTRAFSRAASTTYKPPPLTLLEDDRGKPLSGDIRANANIIQRTLENFGINVDMGEISVGPSVTQYTLKPAEGVKLSRITNLSSNLGLALAAHPLRIEAPIPGRSLVGIEVPNRSIAQVGMRSLMSDFMAKKQYHLLGFTLGRDVTGQPVIADLARMPHILVAGSTGSGKSVTIHALLLGLLFANAPEQLRLILIDPKRVELAYYNNIPHMMAPVIVDAKKAIQALRWAVKEMERRYEELAAAGVRDILSYNNDSTRDTVMPYLVIVIDELADLMTTYPREVEASVVRLAQMARAVGIHLVVSTQRPSVEVITGLIKANITSRIALQVASQIDSRTILDMAGAEKLLGKGDMLYLAGDAAKPRRIQGIYVSEPEVKRVTDYLKNLRMSEDREEENIFAKAEEGATAGDNDASDDDMYEEARALVLETGKASASFFQRRLRVGYARAARLIDILESNGVIGPGDGAKPREVLIGREGAHDGDIERQEV